MHKTIKRAAMAGLFCTLTATQTLADPILYFGGSRGIGLVSSNAASQPGVVATGLPSNLGVFAGVRFDQPGMFYGAELSADFNTNGVMSYGGATCASGSAGGNYFCTRKATLRLRGLVGTQVGRLEVFGTLGYGVMFGQGAIDAVGNTAPGSTGGITYGAGVQWDAGRGKLRVELIHDEFTNIIRRPGGIHAPNWVSNSIRASYVMRF